MNRSSARWLVLVLATAATCAGVVGTTAAGCGDDTTTVTDAGPVDGGRNDGGRPEEDAAIDGGMVVVSHRTFWVATDGDDDNDGSEAAPFASFTHAIAGLLPGDTLLVKDGEYGRLTYDCDNNTCDGEPCPSGAPGAPITVRAVNERRATLSTRGDSVLVVRSCAYVVVEGLEAHQMDDASATSSSQLAYIGESNHITIRRNVFHTPNRYANIHILYVAASDYVLVEENEVYDFHRGAIMIAASNFATVRRNYVNSRGVPNLADGYNCCCLEEGDYGIWLGQSYRATVENNIVEHTCEGYYIYAVSYNDRVQGARGGTAMRLLGNVALTTSTGFRANSACAETDPCVEADRVSDVEMTDCVSVEAGTGFNFDGVDDVVLRNVTSIDASSIDFRFSASDENAALFDVAASFVSVNALDVGTTGVGYRFGHQREGLITGGNSFGNTEDFPDGADYVDGAHGTRDPALGVCTVYLPAGSPMRGAGLGGDVGASIVTRTVDARATTEPLWDPTSGAFPCGAVIAGGVNDESMHPDETCTSVHERLEVGTAACPLP